LGLPLLARPFHEHKRFQYADAYEQAIRYRRPPPASGRLLPEAKSTRRRSLTAAPQ